MTELSPGDFADYFHALWGYPPFAWQQALAERVFTRSDAPWPEAIALPTAAGKTACIDIAVFALAAQALRQQTGAVIKAPRRIFFVVDRRVIVDEAYDRAERLARKLARATVEDGILKTVADALRMIARGDPEGWHDETPLTVHTLRGASYRSESWARSLLQPAIIASTVDQLGSRLLFRAYGRGPGMWPVFAGLTANDSLILLDEAHCAVPFLQTLQAIRRYRTWGEQSLQRGFHPVVLSATPPPGLDTFVDRSPQPRDSEHPLGRRQLAHKQTRLQAVPQAKGKNATAQFAKALATAAEELNAGEGRAVVIFVNRVATARAVRDQLLKRRIGQVTLLTGRMRGIDKQIAIDQHLKPLASTASEQRQLSEPHFVVATQTLEVGADLDFDLLITECAALDALRQRFGRLNRMGRPIEARAAILLRGDQADDDPVYGGALLRTWGWLSQQADGDQQLDLGIAHLPLPDGPELADLNSPGANAPVMLPAHVDCWAQTQPAPQPSPDIALFLHGPRESRPDVQVCWRLAPTPAALQLCPPSAGETLPVPIGLFRRWLAGEALDDDSSDVEGEANARELDTSDTPPDWHRQAFRWSGQQLEDIDRTDSLRPGDLIVIDLALRDSLQLGEFPTGGPDTPAHLDASEQAFLTARAKARLRLHPALIARWPSPGARELALTLLDTEEDDTDEQLRLLRSLLQRLGDDTAGDDQRAWLHDVARQLQHEAGLRGFLRQMKKVSERDLMLCGQGILAGYTRQAETFSDGDDISASGTSRQNGAPVRLHDHLPGVEGWARRFASACDLPPALVDAIARAGLLHDLGKADPRFQALLRGGNPLSLGSAPLAKSGAMPTTLNQYEAARSAAGYPKGGRHELLSVRLAESAPELLPDAPLLRELTLHLVASHHGYCRPFAPVVMDDAAPEVRYTLDGQELRWDGPTQMEHLDAGVARRYWRLIQAYGWWGLAWLEALLRLADHRRSEEEQLQEVETSNG